MFKYIRSNKQDAQQTLSSLSRHIHILMLYIINKRKIKKVVRKTCAERRKITLLKVVKIRKWLEDKVTKLVEVGVQNFLGHFKYGVLKACDEVWEEEGEEKIHGG